METIKYFFQQLANKSHTEPDLSDITSFVLNCSKKFLVFFLKTFFLEELKEISEITSIDVEREIWSENGESRVDFKFNVEGFGIFLVENKIGDRNYHSEYLDNYKNSSLGFIANYDVNIPELNEIYKNHKISWADFYRKLSDFINKNISCDAEKLLLNGYAEYIRSVCGIMEKRDFKPELTKDLEYLCLLFDSLVKKSGENYYTNNTGKSCNINRTGIYFYVQNHSYWVGIYHNEYDNNIWIEVYNRALKEFQQKDGNYCSQPYEEEDSIWFMLKDNYLKELNSDIAVDEKFEILENFFNEVMAICECK